MTFKILIVDDDQAIGEMLTLILRNERLDPYIVTEGQRALAAFNAVKPDLVLLDLMLPGKSGIEICQEIRKENVVPIIMLTAKSDTLDIVEGLESGADDYIVKPFKHKELIARIRTRLRKPSIDKSEFITIGDLQINISAHEVKRAEELLSLTPLEFDLLLELAKKPGQVFTRENLLERVWGYQHPADTRLVNVHIQRLRAKVELDPENPEIVLTVRGIGYKVGSL